MHRNLHDALIDLAGSIESMLSWLRSAGPELDESFAIETVARLPAPVARETLRRWLALRGSEDVTPSSIDRLLQMAIDRATAPRQHFPGGILVRRRAGTIFVDRS